MPQSIRVAIIGQGDDLPCLIRAILDHSIVSSSNLFLSTKCEAAKQAAGDSPVTFCEDVVAATVKSEIVLACASKKQEMDTVLIPIAKCTSNRVVVAVCRDPRVDLAYVKERVANGTEIITATLLPDDNGGLVAHYTIGPNVRLYLHQACRDLVNTICHSSVG